MLEGKAPLSIRRAVFLAEWAQVARTVAGLAASPNVTAQHIAEAVGSPQPLPRLPGGEMKAWGYAHKLGWQDERLWERRLATYGTK